MIELIAASAGCGLAGLATGYLWGRGAARRRAEIALEDQRIDAARLVTDHRRAIELRDTRIQALRASAAVSLTAGHSREPAPERPTARGLERFPGRLRGLATVDDAVVAMADGLLATRCADPDLARAATLAADLGPLFDLRLPGFIGLTIEVRGRDPLSYRLLPEWTRGSWLVARGQGGPVNTSALDGAISGAYVGQTSSPPSLSLTGHVSHDDADALGEAVAAEVGGAFRAVGLVSARGLVAYAAADGPDRTSMSVMAGALVELRARAMHWCGSVISLRLDNPHGEWIGVSPVDRESLLVTVGNGPAIDELALERVRGRLRRLLAAAAAEAAMPTIPPLPPLPKRPEEHAS